MAGNLSGALYVFLSCEFASKHILLYLVHQYQLEAKHVVLPGTTRVSAVAVIVVEGIFWFLSHPTFPWSHV